MLQMSPTIAATWLEALGTLIAHVVRTGKPLDGNWDLLHQVSLMYACRGGCLPGRICMRHRMPSCSSMIACSPPDVCDSAGGARRGRTSNRTAPTC